MCSCLPNSATSKNTLLVLKSMMDLQILQPAAVKQTERCILCFCCFTSDHCLIMPGRYPSEQKHTSSRYKVSLFEQNSSNQLSYSNRQRSKYIFLNRLLLWHICKMFGKTTKSCDGATCWVLVKILAVQSAVVISVQIW